MGNLILVALAAAAIIAIYLNANLLDQLHYRIAGTDWPKPLVPTLLAVGIVTGLLLWKLPVFQVAHSKAITDENRFERENEARKTIAQILAGGFVLMSLYSSVQTFDLSREGQITDRFTKATEQLGALDAKNKPKLEVRLGGIYALERIARDSQKDHWVVMEVLSTYVRERSFVKTDNKRSNASKKKEQPAAQELPHTDADIQAALTVLGRRKMGIDKGVLNLQNTNAVGLDCTNAHFSNADLRNAQLTSAQFNKTEFNGTNFSGANLANADLTEAHLRGAHFLGARLRGAQLTQADLVEVDFLATDLVGAYLAGANLDRAYLTDADLSGADLSKTVGLTQRQIDSARGDVRTQLPAGLHRPAGWAK